MLGDYVYNGDPLLDAGRPPAWKPPKKPLPVAPAADAPKKIIPKPLDAAPKKIIAKPPPKAPAADAPEKIIAKPPPKAPAADAPEKIIVKPPPKAPMQAAAPVTELPMATFEHIAPVAPSPTPSGMVQTTSPNPPSSVDSENEESRIARDKQASDNARTRSTMELRDERAAYREADREFRPGGDGYQTAASHFATIASSDPPTCDPPTFNAVPNDIEREFRTAFTKFQTSGRSNSVGQQYTLKGICGNTATFTRQGITFTTDITKFKKEKGMSDFINRKFEKPYRASLAKKQKTA